MTGELAPLKEVLLVFKVVAADAVRNQSIVLDGQLEEGCGDCLAKHCWSKIITVRRGNSASDLLATHLIVIHFDV